MFSWLNIALVGGVISRIRLKRIPPTTNAAYTAMVVTMRRFRHYLHQEVKVKLLVRKYTHASPILPPCTFHIS
ncbi:MAG: hypothetical protein KatS3mg015_2841 [Fimbriimonadales bacterium]|nr:MAG: hypothetical protein KatS3mg015_2841 [Fimbriimonadales bacterium]